MTPMLGIMASSISGSKAITGNYYSIATALGTGSSGTITFSSIPSTYTHLQLRISARTSASSIAITTTLNSDTATNYAQHYLYGDATNVFAGVPGSAQNGIIYVFAAGSGQLANSYGVNIIDILDYTNTNKYKTTRMISGYDVNGATGFIQQSSGLWMNTSAINRIDLVSSGNFTTASTFALYGVK